MPRLRTDGLRLALGALAALAPGAASARAETPPRPNVLLLIADDWSWPHAGAYGDRAVKTPTFDRLAREGMLFAHAFAAAPSCTPSRAAILTGQYPHRLQEGANLWGFLPRRFAVYPDLLEAAGYTVGLQGKGWGPGNFEAGGYTRNPAGPSFKSFAEFLAKVPAGKPFAFWFGSHHPHRPYHTGAGAKAGHQPAEATVPPYWPDGAETRADIIDYYDEVEQFDVEAGQIIAALEAAGRLDDTLVVMTSDNGMPFPRAKTNLYDAGTRMPLAVRWPRAVKPGRSDAFVNLMDLAPTFLEAARLKVPPDMTGRSLMPLLRGGRDPGREQVFLERERHANVRKGDLGYPARALRTHEFLYIRNLRPERWPGGDPEMWKAVGPFGDCDASGTKEAVLGQRDAPPFAHAFAKRPAEELYDVRGDPHQMKDLARDPARAAALKRLRAVLDRWMRDSKDPRVDPRDDRFDGFPYFGGPAPDVSSAKRAK